MSSSSKDASSWRKKKDQIHFVNARPSSETEKLRIQRMVRAHVGKWISDQTRDRDPAENPNQIIADQHTHNHHNAGHSGLPEVQGLSNRDMSADSLQRVIVKESESELEQKPFSGNCSSSSSSSSSSSPEVRLSGQSSPEAEHAGVGSHWCPVHTVRSSHGPRNKTAHVKDDNSSHNGGCGNDNGHAAATHGLPTMDRIASNTWNPFHAYPSHYSPEFLRLHEGYSLSTIWPFLTPSSPSGSGIAANSTWFPLSLTDSTLFTAFLFSSMSHKCIRWRNRSIPDGAFKPPDFRALQMIEIEAINLINKAIQDPSRAASDAVILSVLCMAHNPTYCSPQNVSPSTPFAAPLQRLQWLEVFGNSAPNIVHVRGLMQMIMLRGGVEKIELPGLASILSLSDIFTASAYLTQPAFAWMPLENSRRGLTLPTLLGFTHLDIERKFGKFKPIGITPEMAETFQAAWVYTRIVDTYIKGAIPKADLSLLTDQRNLVHHTIISLPSATPTTPSSPSTYHHPHKIIYEATRLAALIYSIGVIFPLPAGSSPLSKLASLVQSILQLPSSPSSPTSFCSASNTCIWTSSPAAGTLLFWILLLGGIAAENRPERPWFVTALGHTARRASIVSWDELRGRLEEVLWFDLACEQPGRRLWGEVESSLLSV